MDAEKFSQTSSSSTITASAPAWLTYIRAVQHIFATISVVFISCAIDRNILNPGVSSEEKVIHASSMAAIMVLIYHIVAPHKKTPTVATDGILTAFLFATFVFGAVRAGDKDGVCSGPAKIGVWDNHRGCKRMTVATSFTAVNFASFAASAVLAAVL